MFTDANERKAADDRIAGLNAGYGQLSDLFGQGRTALSGAYSQGTAPLNSIFQQSQGGSSAYADATGVNGADGLARAKAAFTSNPGYTEGLNMGLDANDRRAASRGMLASGNNNIDSIKFATDYANKNYGDYVNRLSPYLTQGTQAAVGLGGLAAGLGGGLNSSFQGQGTAANTTQTGIGNANAAFELSKDQTGLNQLGGLFGGLKLLGGLGGMF